MKSKFQGKSQNGRSSHKEQSAVTFQSTSREGGWTKGPAPKMEGHQMHFLWVILNILSRGSGEKVARDDGGRREEENKHVQ